MLQGVFLERPAALKMVVPRVTPNFARAMLELSNELRIYEVLHELQGMSLPASQGLHSDLVGL